MFLRVVRHSGSGLPRVSGKNGAATIPTRGIVLTITAARPLFEAGIRTQAYLGYGTGSNYGVSPDGRRFLVNAAVAGQTTAPITLVVNWAAALNE